MDDVGFDHQVLVEKLCPVNIVGMDSTHFRRGQIDICGLFLLKKSINRCLVDEVQLLPRSRDDARVAPRF